MRGRTKRNVCESGDAFSVGLEKEPKKERYETLFQSFIFALSNYILLKYLRFLTTTRIITVTIIATTTIGTVIASASCHEVSPPG